VSAFLSGCDRKTRLVEKIQIALNRADIHSELLTKLGSYNPPVPVQLVQDKHQPENFFGIFPIIHGPLFLWKLLKIFRVFFHNFSMLLFLERVFQDGSARGKLTLIVHEPADLFFLMPGLPE